MSTPSEIDRDDPISGDEPSAPSTNSGCFGVKFQPKPGSTDQRAQDAEGQRFSNTNSNGSDNGLSLTFISAQGLKDTELFGKMSCYAVAWIDPATKKTTHLARGSGSAPVWNQTVFLPVPPAATSNDSLYINVVGRRRLRGDSVRGSVVIPLGQILSNGTGATEYLSCQLVRPSGKIRGVLNLSLHISTPKRQGVGILTERRRTTFTDIDVHAISQELDRQHPSTEPLSVHPPCNKNPAIENPGNRATAPVGCDETIGSAVGGYLIGHMAATALVAADQAASCGVNIGHCLDFIG